METPNLTKREQSLLMAGFLFLRLQLRWGNTLDKDGKSLSQMRLIPIFKISTSHLRAIIDTQFQMSPLFQNVMETELFCRESGYIKRNQDGMDDLIFALDSIKKES